MQTDDLPRQDQPYGGLPPRLVEVFLEHGHLELVVRAATDRADWFCARAAARALCADGEFDRAHAVLEPFARTGWPPAVAAGADALARAGRLTEALALTGTGSAEGRAGAAEAARVRAGVLVAAGRVGEAISVLAPHLADGRTPSALVELTAGQGHDGRLLDLLTPLAGAARTGAVRNATNRFGFGSGVFRDGWRALVAQAEVLERAGRADEAVALLGADVAGRRYGPENTVVAYARLLGRRGRIDLLRELVTGGHRRAALDVFVRALEDAGRAAEAEAFLRAGSAPGPDPDRSRSHHRSELVELLVRGGRPEEAIAAARATFESADDDNLLQPVVLLLAEHGLHARALELLVERSPTFVEEQAHWIPSNRWWLMGELDRCREAIAEARSALADDPVECAATLAELLALDGRFDEAVALLPSCAERAGEAAVEIAQHLVRHGRPVDALALVPGVRARREAHERQPARWRQSHPSPSGVR